MLELPFDAEDEEEGKAGATTKAGWVWFLEELAWDECVFLVFDETDVLTVATLGLDVALVGVTVVFLDGVSNEITVCNGLVVDTVGVVILTDVLTGLFVVVVVCFVLEAAVGVDVGIMIGLPFEVFGGLATVGTPAGVITTVV